MSEAKSGSNNPMYGRTGALNHMFGTIAPIAKGCLSILLKESQLVKKKGSLAGQRRKQLLLKLRLLSFT